MYIIQNNYFDIVLDSVNTIINNFEIKEIKFDVFSDINIETEPIDYTDQPNIVEMLKEDREEVVEMDENLGRKKTFKYRS